MTTQNPQLVSFREYARRRGVALSSVQEAIKSGRISTLKDSDGKIKIDPVRADEEWQCNTDPSKRPPRPGEKKRPQEAFDFYQAKAKHEHFKAELLQLEYEQQAGITVNLAELEGKISAAARELHDALFNIPLRLSSKLALETNALVIDATLTREITDVLNVFLESIKNATASNAS